MMAGVATSRGIAITRRQWRAGCRRNYVGAGRRPLGRARLRILFARQRGVINQRNVSPDEIEAGGAVTKKAASAACGGKLSRGGIS